LGILQIRNTIFAPFALTNAIPSSVKESVNDVNNLRYRDTDFDGLSDYDETYVYDTSPYLADTFGYGMTDKEVVEKGLPRCANAGKNCSNESTPAAVAASTSSTLPALPTELAQPDITALMNDPKQVRSLLVANGMDKQTLDKISDSDLMQLVTQLMTSSTITSSTN
jgi:hypothetical protein